MKKIVIVIILILYSFLLIASNDVLMFKEREISITSPTVPNDRTNSYFREGAPPFEISGDPINIMLSYYDYFPGNYTSFPMVKQPSPAGFHEGGGIYIIFQATPEAGGTRSIYYTYIQGGQVITTSSLAPGGFPGVDMDYETGNPLISWHGNLPDDPTWQVFFAFDQYDAIGYPGLWSEPYVIVNNTDLEEGYIWPVVKIGPSPNEGKRRAYMFGTNSEEIGPMTQGNNKYLVYTDFSDISDLASYDEDDWTGYEIPYMRQWANNYHRAYDDIVVTSDGKVAITGNIFDWGNYMDDDWPGGYSEHDALFVLVNNNYGIGDTEEDWDLHLYDGNLKIDNPDDFFTGDDGEPLDYLRAVPFPPRFTASVDGNDDILIPFTYRLASEQANRLYFNQSYVKLMRFNFDNEEFSVSDLWPRSKNPDAFPYAPWDPEGDGQWEYIHFTEEDSSLAWDTSWPVWWWDDSDFQPENYTRIATSGRYAVVAFQESMKARRYNEYNEEDYENWADKPEIYILVSEDYGHTWKDPIIMNANPDDENYQPKLHGMIPSYVYAGDTIDEIGDGWIRVHLMMFDQNNYGSSIQENSLPTGGNIVYLPLDIKMSTSVEDVVKEPGVNNLLLTNYPNPFNPTTTIHFSLQNNDYIDLAIYNIKGQRVKSLVAQDFTAGNHYITWNGNDDQGDSVSSGVYYSRLESSSGTQVHKMLLVK